LLVSVFTSMHQLSSSYSLASASASLGDERIKHNDVMSPKPNF